MNKIQMPEGLGLRQAAASDQGFIASLFHSTRESFYLAEQEPEYIRMVIDQQLALQEQGYGEQSPNAYTFIVEKQSTSIGRLILDFGKNIAHVLDITLIQEARGKGYAKAIIQAVQHIAQQQGLPVGLSAELQNYRAKKLYISLGFLAMEQSSSHVFYMWYPKGTKVFA